MSAVGLLQRRRPALAAWLRRGLHRLVWVVVACGVGLAPAQEESAATEVDAAQASQQVQVEVLAFAFRAVELPSGTTAPRVDYAARSVPPPAPAYGQQLGTAWQRLQDDPATRPLVHLRWRQGLYEQQWIRLEGGADLDGRLLLKPGKPMRISIEATLEPGSTQAQQLVLTRNIRFGEHLYFDHRAFGVIVRVDPVVDPAR